MQNLPSVSDLHSTPPNVSQKSICLVAQLSFFFFFPHVQFVYLFMFLLPFWLFPFGLWFLPSKLIIHIYKSFLLFHVIILMTRWYQVLTVSLISILVIYITSWRGLFHVSSLLGSSYCNLLSVTPLNFVVDIQ